MKKMIILLFVVTILCIVTANVQAYELTFTGQTMIGSSAGSTTSVQTSNNVSIYYISDSQHYGMASKHTAGDRVYAGWNSVPSLYYQQDTVNWPGKTMTDTGVTVDSAGTITGWTAQ